MKLPYNPDNLISILDYAEQLKGKTLNEACKVDLTNKFYNGKGGFGQTLEKFYFLYNPNSDTEPDFPSVGLELKTSPLKVLKNNEYRAKERLVLNIINYIEVVKENFERSSFWKKNAHLLLIFYFHEKNKTPLDYIIKLVSNWQYPPKDLLIIKQDWETINKKIQAGKAHELSEGDTFYLGACTKGSKGGNLRLQPNNKTLAKQRAYSLKSSYLNHIIATISKEEKEVYGKLIDSEKTLLKKSVEEIVLEKFQPLLGLSIEILIKRFSLLSISSKGKNFHSLIAKAICKSILNVPLDKNIIEHIEEFSKADLLIKTVRLKNNNSPAEGLSFPSFQYLSIYNGSWINSDFKYQVERKYLFVFFKYNNQNQLLLDKVKFWNMPNQDLYLAKKIWINLKQLISKGTIVKNITVNKNGNEIRHTYFPSIRTSNFHIRPHGINKNDTYSLPIREKLTQKKEYTKHSFWFNKKYIMDEIYLK